MGGEAGRGDCVAGSSTDVLAPAEAKSTGLGAFTREDSSSINVWLKRLSGGCSCSGAGPTSSESVVFVGGEPMELEELDRLLSGKSSSAEVEFPVQLHEICWSLRLSLLSCNGLKASAFQKEIKCSGYLKLVIHKSINFCLFLCPCLFTVSLRRAGLCKHDNFAYYR